MNAMCDLTQFIVSIIVSDAYSEPFGKLFIEQVVFSFGMVAVIVVGANCKFLGLFEEMCNELELKLWALSRSNHKGLHVESYHSFLNKTKTIVGQDRGTHHSIFDNCETS